MKKIFFITLILVVVVHISNVFSQSKRYVIAFYNVENLFDTIRNPEIYDEEFTPNGPNQWNSHKYWKKIANIEEVIVKMREDTKTFPIVIGVSEIENRAVLEDVVSAKKLLPANYQIAHYDSPDARGVDVGLIYRPDVFKYEGSYPIPFTLPGEPGFRSRDVLMVWGTIEGEKFYFFVNHWPSRRGGHYVSEYKRVAAAETVKNAADSVMRIYPDAKIVIMGDLNDDPNDKSVAVTLGAKEHTKDVVPNGFYNPYAAMHKKGFGTLGYQDNWNIFDNIIVNENLLNGTTGELKLYKPSSNKFYGNIYDRPFLRVQSGQYKNYPFRTYVGGAFQGGYSDHFPVYIYIAK